MQRLSQRESGVLAARLRPEEGNERVATLHTQRLGKDEIAEEREPLRLYEECA
jgi:hypothetical protein